MEEEKKWKECIVVEGKDDTKAIQRAVQADTIETNGSAIGEDVLARIALAKERRGVIILTDPDVAGERIRRIVSTHVAGCKHAFLTRKEALSPDGQRFGVEYAKPEVIRRALSKVRETKEESEPEREIITRQDLMDAGMMYGHQAKSLRARVGEILNIGYANAKQFLKRLDMFHISREEFAQALQRVLEEEEARAKTNRNPKSDE
ncbi:ribonuclease M5 [Aliibacillus thermotolerans]|uniref:Ribonuclease M5 n=1 Tax=Aliibacillus thermotolerans TaxID=1834418 RepID=A0ABW0U8K0_9BACI|nr:ribonuclease M5 [Aliibacillus thermotolerans]MDA3128869.1 ribonuclease M5 [Aliibacillus thermotolerans]